MSLAGQIIRGDGVDLNVHAAGSGPSVLLLHGFPDSNALWRHVIPELVAGGYRVIAPDQRGYGESDAPRGSRHYRIEYIVRDAIRVLDEFGIERAHVVGHDWGAVIGWFLAGEHPDRFLSLTAVSVGHPRAYASAGLEQKRRSGYAYFFQLRGVAERVIRSNDFAWFRKWLRNESELDTWITDLSRPGRLTAALNWYRANLVRILAGRHPRCPIPAMGIWSSGDFALTEEQMTRSVAYVDDRWLYQRFDNCGHWIPLQRPVELSRSILEFIAN